MHVAGSAGIPGVAGKQREREGEICLSAMAYSSSSVSVCFGLFAISLLCSVRVTIHVVFPPLLTAAAPSCPALPSNPQSTLPLQVPPYSLLTTSSTHLHYPVLVPAGSNRPPSRLLFLFTTLILLFSSGPCLPYILTLLIWHNHPSPPQCLSRQPSQATSPPFSSKSLPHPLSQTTLHFQPYPRARSTISPMIGVKKTFGGHGGA